MINTLNRFPPRLAAPWMLVLVLWAMGGGCVWGGSPGLYQPQALLIGGRIAKVLIGHGYCQTVPDCNRRQWRFVAPTSEGVAIEVYEIDDPLVISEIVAACMALYAENHQTMAITLTMRRQTHPHTTLFERWWRKPFFRLELQGSS